MNPAAPPSPAGTSEGGVVLVLGAGGARGVALAAVLGALRREGVRLDGIIGCSVGGIVGAMYAAAGMTPEEMIEAARLIRPGVLLAWAASRWRLPLVSRAALRRAGAIPGFLDRLGRASFDRLHHGVRRLGILTFDLVAREEILVHGGPGLAAGLPLAVAVKASAAIPGLFPPLPARHGGKRRLLVDPGWLTAVPIERAFAPPFSARHVVAVDLSLRVCLRQRGAYWSRLDSRWGGRLAVLRPDVRGSGTIISRPGDPARLVGAGEDAVAAALPLLRSWQRGAGGW